MSATRRLPALLALLAAGAIPSDGLGCCGATLARKAVEALMVEIPPDYFPAPPYPLQRYPLRGPYRPEGGADYDLETDGEAPQRKDRKPPPRSGPKRKPEPRLSRLGELSRIASAWRELDDDLKPPRYPAPTADHQRLREWLDHFPFPRSKKDADRIPQERIAGLEAALSRYQRFVDARGRATLPEKYRLAVEILLYDVSPERKMQDASRAEKILVEGQGYGSYRKGDNQSETRALEDANAEAKRNASRNAQAVAEASRARMGEAVGIYHQILSTAEDSLAQGGLLASEAVIREVTTYLLADGKLPDAREHFEEKALSILERIGPQNAVPCAIEAMSTDHAGVREYLYAMVRELSKDAGKPPPDPKWKREEWIAWHEAHWGPWPLGPAPTLDGLDLSPVAVATAPSPGKR